jgi:hypothetical protein
MKRMRSEDKINVMLDEPTVFFLSVGNFTTKTMSRNSYAFAEADRLLSAYGECALAHALQMTDKYQQESIVCATLSLLVCSEEWAVSQHLWSTKRRPNNDKYVHEGYVAHLVKAMKAANLTRNELDSVRTHEIYKTRDRLFVDSNEIGVEFSEFSGRPISTAVLLSTAGVYLGHVYVWQATSEICNMIGIRKSVPALVAGIKGVARQILKGVLMHMRRMGASFLDTMSPVGVMANVVDSLIGSSQIADWLPATLLDERLENVRVSVKWWEAPALPELIIPEAFADRFSVTLLPHIRTLFNLARPAVIDEHFMYWVTDQILELKTVNVVTTRKDHYFTMGEV